MSEIYAVRTFQLQFLLITLSYQHTYQQFLWTLFEAGARLQNEKGKLCLPKKKELLQRRFQ